MLRYLVARTWFLPAPFPTHSSLFCLSPSLSPSLLFTPCKHSASSSQLLGELVRYKEPGCIASSMYLSVFLTFFYLLTLFYSVSLHFLHPLSPLPSPILPAPHFACRLFMQPSQTHPPPAGMVFIWRLQLGLRAMLGWV